MVVYSKICTACDNIATYNLLEDEEYNCPYTYRSGLSKAMETSVALDMVVSLCSNSKNNIGIECILYFDGSTMHAQLHHPANNKIGELPNNIPEPSFLEYTSHRIKVMCKEVFKLSLSIKQSSYYELIDALQLKKYIGCCVYKNIHLPLEEFVGKSMALVEHLFDCHK